MMNNGAEIMSNIRRIDYDEFLNLKNGDVVYVVISSVAYKSKVIGVPFYNADADEPDWEVETDNGFCDAYSLYVTK